MKRFIITALLVLLVGVVAVGFSRGWFTLWRGSAAAGSGKINVNLTVDPEKMQQDAQTMKDEAAELAAKVTNQGLEPGTGQATK